MLKLNGGAVGICKGSALVFSAFESDGEMWKGEGPRFVSHPVSFDDNFLAPPMVHISLNMFDIGWRENARADISAEQITAEGFRIVFRTWGDTKVARVRAEWMAIGPIRHVDDFTGI